MFLSGLARFGSTAGRSIAREAAGAPWSPYPSKRVFSLFNVARPYSPCRDCAVQQRCASTPSCTLDISAAS